MKENRRYVTSIAPTVGYVQENLARHPELQALREILEEYLFAAFAVAPPRAEMRTPDTSPYGNFRRELRRG
ncbi:MAG: hypothetical protein HYZ81_21995 [Nitrospinae bacterium]|nr:hypothetical protein [Nitrospinota bacterium]